MLKRFLLALNVILMVPLSSYATMTQEMLHTIFKTNKKVDNCFKELESLSKKNKFSECIQAIDKLIAIATNELKDKKLKDKFVSFLWAIRGDGHCTLKKYTQALKDCDTALTIDKDNGVAYYTKARIHLAFGDKKSSDACLKTATAKGFVVPADKANSNNTNLWYTSLITGISIGIIVMAASRPAGFRLYHPYSWVSQRVGNFNYRNDSFGNTYTTQSLGNFDYVNGSNGYSGTGQRIGNFYYYNDQNGNYTSNTIGNFDYVSGSNGYSGTGQRIGNFYYYNDNQGNSHTSMIY